jgi:hypothetical protein
MQQRRSHDLERVGGPSGLPPTRQDLISTGDLTKGTS